MQPKKQLGQHWLTDDTTLEYICNSADLDTDDIVLEIGPGTGSLTKHLLKRVKKVVAVEKDEQLAAALPSEVEVVTGDVLQYDLSQLPGDYKVVANIPYYLTSKLLRILSESPNPPASMTLLVQKEVAERICAGPGQMSILAVSVQLYYECHLGQVVPARLFLPPPKVDSQVVVLHRRQAPLFAGLNDKKFFRLVKAGFSERRKKLRSSLAGGLGMSREDADRLLKNAGIDGSRRAQELSLEEWHKLLKTVESGEWEV